MSNFSELSSNPAVLGMDDAYVAPRNPLEQELTRIWQSILELPQIGVHDDFFELGGHSLLAIEIRAQVRAALSAAKLQIDVLLTPTIASMAESIFATLTRAASQSSEPVE